MQPTGWIARSMHLAQRCRAARVAVGGAIVVAAQALATAATPDGPALVLTSVEVRAVSRVEPGAELAFSVHATPGARVRLRIDGASQALRLAETAPGHYQGTYIVAARDRIGPRSKLALKLRHERGMQTARVGRPLQVDWPEPASAIDTTHIDSVAVVAEPGRADVLRVVLQGSPGGRVMVQMTLQRTHTVWLQEERSGHYSGMLPLPRGEGVDLEQALPVRLTTAQGTS